MDDSTNSTEPRLPLGKHCNKCEEWKMFEEFSRHKRSKDGRNWTCKECARVLNRQWRDKNPGYQPPCFIDNPDYKKQWYQGNKEHQLEKQRQRRIENAEQYAEYQRRYREDNKEKIAAAIRRWEQENPEKAKERMRRYYERHRERLLERSRRWLEANPDYPRRYREENIEQVKATARRWREENKDQVAAISRRRYARQLGAEGSHTLAEWLELCEAWGNKCLSCGEERTLTVDHVIPLSKGGSNDISNIQALCGPCNSSKGAKTTDYR